MALLQENGDKILTENGDKILREMKFLIELTWSKIVAVLVLGCAFALDVLGKTTVAFQFSLPFVVFLITGKQFLDLKKEKK